MPKSIIIQTIVGFTICAIALSIFAFSVLRIVASTEFYMISADGTLTLTPDPDRAYHIAARSHYQKSDLELLSIYQALVVTSDNGQNRFTLADAPGREYSGRTKMNTSTHTSSVARINFITSDPIMLTIQSTQPSSDHSLVVMSRVDVTITDMLVPVILLLIGTAVGVIVGIRFVYFSIKSDAFRLKHFVQSN